ncbi:MAG TPA: magnesium/cobalt transporter CorA [Sedimentisphaerales bacterium]|nr:magnesium/cobalt transporter CorA [Sedimentisphaerales bacterium]HQG47820.1 magnesium/cobalt transporter CorA [Sedimentisphaerales bacterium]HQI26514.1 magnesium/cobalt transporter CorA [Sedimentisphaerales bacterium]
MGGKSKRRNAALNRRTKKSGLPPGTLVHIGEKREQAVLITYMDYDENSFQEKQGATVEECFAFKDTQTVTWINIDGIDDIPIIEKIGKAYDLHPLILEDIATAGQRPKFDNYDKYIYIVLKMLTYNYANHAIESEQISIVFGSNFVISFQENVGDIFNPIRDRIRLAKGRIRKMGSDYLAYSLIDAIVDGYFVILERIGEQIDGLEDELIERPTEGLPRQIHALKREMMSLRRSVWPLRELINAMQRDESPLISSQTRIYLRDVYDHTVQIIDTIEGFRDVVAGMLDVYLSSISNRTNAIMKVLTMIATIFIPLTFVAGVYGMNFRYMPEIEWRWGYPAVLLLMLIIAAIMVAYFRRRRWL